MGVARGGRVKSAPFTRTDLTDLVRALFRTIAKCYVCAVRVVDIPAFCLRGYLLIAIDMRYFYALTLSTTSAA